MKRLIDYDPYTKTKTYHDYDHSSGKTVIETSQDVSQFLKRNKALQNEASYRQSGFKNDYMHFATVPNAVIMEWKEKYNLDVFNDEDMPKIEKLLQSNEYKYLRTVDRI